MHGTYIKIHKKLNNLFDTSSKKLEVKLRNLKQRDRNIIELSRNINDFKKGYQPRTNIVKLIWLQTPTQFWLSEWVITVSCWKVHGVKYVRYTETHTADPLMSKARVFDFEMSNEKQKDVNHQLLVKFQLNWLNEVVGKFVLNYSFYLYGGIAWEVEGANSFTYLYKVIKQTVVITGAYYFYHVHKNFILHSSLKDNSMYRENYWDFHCGFRRNRPTTDPIFCIFQVPEKK